jgi:hypothetical protein
VIEESHTEAGTLVDARLRGEMAEQFEPWLVRSNER